MIEQCKLATHSPLTLAALLLLVAARPAQAQTETTLYDFGGGSDGANPRAGLTSDGKGNFYGTTEFGTAYGTSGDGTVFELSPNSTAGWNHTVLYSFCSVNSPYYCEDGANPFEYVIFDKVGNLYGTAYTGGEYGYGVVFELSPGETGWTETVLHSFDGMPDDGAYPVTGLTMDQAGNLYGTNDAGVFELSPSGDGWTEQVIYAENNSSFAGLTIDAEGRIFGATVWKIFKLSPIRGGGWNATTIYTFRAQDALKHGVNPQGTIVLDNTGNLYGTTFQGGAESYGTVYKVSRDKKGKWTEKILHSFRGGHDGSFPVAGIVFDSAGNIYGTTLTGGRYGDGAVYEASSPRRQGLV